MKKLILGAVALAVAGFASAQTTGQTNGTVKFEGEVVDNTCVVQTGKETQTVTLPTVGQTAFVGSTKIGRQSFTIFVSGCKTNATGGHRIRANFSSPHTDITSYALKNTHTATPVEPKAKNVQLRLHESDGTHIKLGDSSYKPTENKDFLDVQGKTGGEIQYHVEYIKHGNEDGGAVTTGKVKSEVEYSIVYQ